MQSTTGTASRRAPSGGDSADWEPEPPYISLPGLPCPIPLALRVLVAGHEIDHIGLPRQTVQACLAEVLKVIKKVTYDIIEGDPACVSGLEKRVTVLEKRVTVVEDTERLSVAKDTERVTVLEETERVTVLEETERDVVVEPMRCRMSVLAFVDEGIEGLEELVSGCGYAFSVIPDRTPPGWEVHADADPALPVDYDEHLHEQRFLQLAARERDRAALGFSDLVVVVWDGHEPRNSPERTVHILREALVAHKVIIWIGPPDGERPGDRPKVKITSLEELSKVDALNLPPDVGVDRLQKYFDPVATTDHRPTAALHDGGRDEQDLHLDPHLTRILKALLSTEAAEQIIELFKHVPRWRIHPGLADRLLRWLVLWWAGPVAGTDTEIPDSKKEAGGPEHEEKPETFSRAQLHYHPRWRNPLWESEPGFDKWYQDSDVKANLVAGDYRSRTWLVHLLGAVALTLGAIAIVLGFGATREHKSLKWQGVIPLVSHSWGILLELAAVAMAGFAVLIGGQTLHWRWPRVRSLAEYLRYQSFVYPIAGVIAPLRRPLWQLVSADDAPTGSEHKQRKPIVLSDVSAWLLHRLNVGAGLPPTGGDGPPLVNAAGALEDSDFRARLVDMVREQGKYHQRKHAIEDKVHRRLKHLSGGLFWITLGVIFARVILQYFEPPALPYLNVLVIAAPAITAALYGVGTQLEVGRLASQSEQQADSLKEVLDAIDDIEKDDLSPAWQVAFDTRRLLIKAADHMATEFAQWHALVESHPLEVA